MKVQEKRRKRCLACKGKQASHKCYGSWHEKVEGRDVMYVCSCTKCQPPTSSLSNLLRF